MVCVTAQMVECTEDKDFFETYYRVRELLRKERPQRNTEPPAAGEQQAAAGSCPTPP
jgi:hypothetical protein